MQLLHSLDYASSSDGFRHADRQAVFCGDFIDRGPQIREVLQIVRQMEQSGAAIAVMGNHEFNAIAFHTTCIDAPGEFCRPHSEKNVRQHQATLDQIPAAELADWLDWFRTLPVAADLGPIRVVHACWDPAGIDFVNASLSCEQPFDAAFMSRATAVGDPLFEAIETVLKGPEMKLPDGIAVADKEGTPRRRVRIRWFESPQGRDLGDYALPQQPSIPRVPVPADAPAVPYPRDAAPVFFGHYWLPPNAPEPLAANIACLDFSVAKGGLLCAYRFDGESELSADRFVTVRSRSAEPFAEPMR